VNSRIFIDREPGTPTYIGFRVSTLGNFNPIAPRRAAELAAAADLAEAATVLADFAVAGLIKAYARVIETTHADGTRTEVRDSRIPRDLWRRICDEGRTSDIWSSGSVRLAGSDLRGGVPAVSLIGIRFDDKSLLNVVAQHGGPVGHVQDTSAESEPRDRAAVPASAPSFEPAPAPAPAVQEPVSTADPEKPLHRGIPHGAVTVTVAQAAAALGIGRTTVDKLMRNGTLVRVKVGARTLITADSIRVLTATADR
jgi:excisionase family DNA binding protein